MKIIEPGHIYQLTHLDGVGTTKLTFVNREEGTKHEGTQTQEVLRALIDRTRHCHKCLPWHGNRSIVQYLRLALALHEARALVRKVEKELYDPENILVGADGHFQLRYTPPGAEENT